MENKTTASAIQSSNIQVLLQISNALMSEKNLDRLLKLIVDRASALLYAERTSIFLLDNDTNELYTRVAQLNEISEIRFPADKGIAGCAVTNPKLINIPDAYKDSRFNQEIDKETGYRTHNILCAPMLNHKNEVVGVLQVLNKKSGGFGLEDELLIMALAAQAAVAVENAHLYHEQELTLKSFLKTLASAIDARDPATAGHSERVARLAINIGKAIGFNETELKMLDYSAALHDVGKIGVPDRILLKPGTLTPEEFEEMKRHAVRTKEILDNMFFSRELREIPHVASTHHEKLDGSGYPEGLKGDQMTISAKILAIADVYDALVAQDRSYRKAVSHEQAIAILEEGRDTKFDGKILDIFKKKKLYLIERRKYQRITVRIPFDYQLKTDKKELSEKLLLQETIDISAAGLLMANKRLYPLGTELNIIIKLDSKNYNLMGRIARADKKFAKNIYHIGIAFTNITGSEQEELSTVLHQPR
ncbi:MAG: HD domain-containing phosphohydrolase [Planctomycetota bacterium]